MITFAASLVIVVAFLVGTTVFENWTAKKDAKRHATAEAALANASVQAATKYQKLYGRAPTGMTECINPVAKEATK